MEAELKKGTTPFLILALLEVEPRHGYELSKLIESRSHGVVRIHAASLYPLLYRMEEERWIEGRWVEKPAQRRRRYYQLTPEGRRRLETHRRGWREFVRAIGQITGVEYA
jgi:PadR family transcriptional regulator, regulatory protein PadR